MSLLESARYFIINNLIIIVLTAGTSGYLGSKVNLKFKPKSHYRSSSGGKEGNSLGLSPRSSSLSKQSSERR